MHYITRKYNSNGKLLQVWRGREGKDQEKRMPRGERGEKGKVKEV